MKKEKTLPWIALVGPEIEENLSLRYLAASLRAAGFHSEILPFNQPGDFVPVLQRILSAPQQPLLVAVSLSFQWRAMDFISLAVALKERGYRGHITAGGHFGAFAWREILSDFPELDSICRHEAEETLAELASAVNTEKSIEDVAGLALRGQEGDVLYTSMRWPPDLHTLPWPDRRGEPTNCLGHRIAPLVCSRGCYANCAFCCIAAWHKHASSGERFRLRPVEDVADEMVFLNKHRHIDIFIFHDDNFFLPSRKRSLERTNGLADALHARGMGRFATVVKARPNDVAPEVFGAMRERLGCIRTFLGIETDAQQGLRTLGRGISSSQNHRAMRILNDLGVYVCFNMLVFDPETTVESLVTNLDFMEAHADTPHNFGRVELYAGTPLLARMQRDGRCRGDYLGWDYRLAGPQMQRIFELSMRCFSQRNFAVGAMANRLMGTRFDVEVCRFFHPDLFDPSWLEESKELNRLLTLDSVAGLREIISFVQGDGGHGDTRSLARDLSRRLRKVEKELKSAAIDLEERIRTTVSARCSHVLSTGASILAEQSRSSDMNAGMTQR